MKTEETKDKETKAGGADFGCCSPENFKEMFKNMSKCFPGQGGSTDFSSMKGDMMKKMMEMCCPSTTTDIKESTELKKKHEGEVETTEKEGGYS